MKQVIHIFGAAGSGTSTLAAAFCKRTGFRHLDTDDFYWLPVDPPFTEKRDPKERVALISAAIDASENAVLSGSVVGWGDPLIPYFTLAVRLFTPTDVRLQRLKARESERFGARILPGGDMYEEQQAFYRWAAGYDTGGVEMRSKAMHDAWSQKLSCPLLTLDGTQPVEALVGAVLLALQRKEDPHVRQI